MSGLSTPRTPESDPEELPTTEQREKRRMSSAPPPMTTARQKSTSPMAVSNLRRKSPKGMRSYADIGNRGIMTVSQDKKGLTTLRLKAGLGNLPYTRYQGNGDQYNGN